METNTMRLFLATCILNEGFSSILKIIDVMGTKTGKWFVRIQMRLYSHCSIGGMVISECENCKTRTKTGGIGTFHREHAFSMHIFFEFRIICGSDYSGKPEVEESHMFFWICGGVPIYAMKMGFSWQSPVQNTIVVSSRIIQNKKTITFVQTSTKQSKLLIFWNRLSHWKPPSKEETKIYLRKTKFSGFTWWNAWIFLAWVITISVDVFIYL